MAEKGVELVHCDVNSREECLRVFKSAYGVFAVTSFRQGRSTGEYQQAMNIIDAAKEAGVKHLIFSIFPDVNQPDHDATDSNRLEDYLRHLSFASPFEYLTIIRVGYYYQDLITFFATHTPTWEFRYPQLPAVRIPLYDGRDTGKIIVECFREPEKYANTNEVIPVVSEQLTMEEICSRVEQFARKEVRFVELPYDEALRKLILLRVTTLRWYCLNASADENQAQVTAAICPQMRKFVDWMQEVNQVLE